MFAPTARRTTIGALAVVLGAAGAAEPTAAQQWSWTPAPACDTAGWVTKHREPGCQRVTCLSRGRCAIQIRYYPGRRLFLIQENGCLRMICSGRRIIRR